MQWAVDHRVRGTTSTSVDQPGLWNDAPAEGHLPVAVAARLAAVLARHTDDRRRLLVRRWPPTPRRTLSAGAASPRCWSADHFRWPRPTSLPEPAEQGPRCGGRPTARGASSPTRPDEHLRRRQCRRHGRRARRRRGIEAWPAEPADPVAAGQRPGQPPAGRPNRTAPAAKLLLQERREVWSAHPPCCPRTGVPMRLAAAVPAPAPGRTP